MASLTGRVISVTGAASGIARAFSKLAGARGAKLAIADFRKGPLDEVESELRSSGVDVKATVVDVRSAKEVDDWINGTVKHFGHLDGAANMAGILPREQLFADTDNEMWDQVIQTNLYGVMHCVRAQIKVMKKGSSIVNAASVAALRPEKNQLLYSITKSGVATLTRGVAKEVAGKGIRIHAVGPGPIMTPMVTNAYPDVKPVPDEYIPGIIPVGRFGQAEDVASLMAYLISDESGYMNGHVTYIDGGYAC